MTTDGLYDLRLTVLPLGGSTVETKTVLFGEDLAILLEFGGEEVQVTASYPVSEGALIPHDVAGLLREIADWLEEDTPDEEENS